MNRRIVEIRLFILCELAGRFSEAFGNALFVGHFPVDDSMYGSQADTAAAGNIPEGRRQQGLLDPLRGRSWESTPLFLFSIASGMRQSEQFRGQVGDYNPKTGMLTVHQKKDRNKPMVRYAPLGKIGAAAYAQLAGGKKKKDALLCLNTEGTPMTDVAYWFKPALAVAKVKDYHWHDNRHTACSRWVMGGVPLAAVSKYVGHSTAQMTMRYAHLMPGANTLASSVVDAFYANEGQREVATDTGTGTVTISSFSRASKLL